MACNPVQPAPIEPPRNSPPQSRDPQEIDAAEDRRSRQLTRAAPARDQPIAAIVWVISNASGDLACCHPLLLRRPRGSLDQTAPLGVKRQRSRVAAEPCSAPATSIFGVSPTSPVRAAGGAGLDQWSAGKDYDRFRMADRADLEFTYSLIDRIFRLSLGELADFSGAKYDGDFSLTLEEAQRRKHEYVAEQIGIGAGPTSARSRLRVGAAVEFHPQPRRHRGRRHVVLRAGRCLPAARPRRPPLRRAPGHPRQLRRVRRRGERRWLRALLFTGRLPRRAPGRDLSRSVRRGSRACCPTTAGSTSRRWSGDPT